MNSDYIYSDNARSVVGAKELEREKKMKINFFEDRKTKSAHMQKHRIIEGKSFNTPWGEVVTVKRVLSHNAVILEGKRGTYSPLQLISID